MNAATDVREERSEILPTSRDSEAILMEQEKRLMASTAVVPATSAAPAVAAPKAAPKAAAKPKVAKKAGANKKKVKSKKHRFVIDCSVPANDGVLDSTTFEKFLAEHIKVGGKINNLGEQVFVRRNNNSIAVTSKGPMSKRYVKYLSKKFLKKKNLKDYMRLVATDKHSYSIKYYNINQGEGEEEE